MLTSNNIIYYFNEYNIDELLIQQLNEAESPIDFEGVDKDFDKETAKKFFFEITLNENIDIGRYQEIVQHLGWSFDAHEIIDDFDIPTDNMKILATTGCLPVDWSMLKYLRENHEELLLLFVKSNFHEFLKLTESTTIGQDEEFPLIEIFELDDFLEMLEWDFDDDEKVELLKHIELPVSSLKGAYTDDLKSYIVEYSITEQEFYVLFEYYSEYQEKTKSAIKKNAIYNISLICDELLDDEDFNISDELLDELFALPTLDLNQTPLPGVMVINREYKIRLLTDVVIPKKDILLIDKYLKKIGNSDLEKLFNTTGRSRFEDLPESKLILEQLKEYELIRDYEKLDSGKLKVTKK